MRVLTGVKKKLVKEVISYYIDTTGLSEDVFILTVQRKRNKPIENLEYSEWLALSSFSLLASQGITLVDCLQFRDLSKQIKRERKGIYLDSVWKREIAREIEKEITKDSILVEISDLEDGEFNYITDKKEIIAVQKANGDKLNILNTFDFDINNRFFLDRIPVALRKAIEENKEIIININPYVEEKEESPNIVEVMNLFGWGKKQYNTTYFKMLFRLIGIKNEYNLTNLKICFYGPLTMFSETKEYKEFYDYFKSNFIFKRGVFFDATAAGMKSKEDYVSYTIWEVNRTKEENSVVLTEKIQHTEDTILDGAKKLIRGKAESIYIWCDRNTKIDKQIELPKLVNINTISEEIEKVREDSIGFMLSSPNMLRMIKKVGITNLPMAEYQEITESNFWQCVASYGVRACLEDKVSMTPKFISSPDTRIKGYSSWLADALILFLFNTSSMMVSYRQSNLNKSNKLFPIAQSEIERITKDEEILRDIEENEAENTFILERIKEVENSLSIEAMELYIFGKVKIKESLQNSKREEIGYKNNLKSWDASLFQIRTMENIFTIKEDEKYIYLLDKLKDKLYTGLYTYGFVAENN